MRYHPVLINMNELIDIVKANGIEIQSIAEIGSLHGKDADAIAKAFNTKDVTIFEAHPTHAKTIQDRYPDYNVINAAISNDESSTTFNIVLEGNEGRSSTRMRVGVKTQQIKVPHFTMESVIEFRESAYDLVKIDVEGATDDVLYSFGERIKEAKVFHVEAEHIEVWDGQRMYPDVERILIESGFICAAIKMAWPQSDSVWIRKDLYNAKWWKNGAI